MAIEDGYDYTFTIQRKTRTNLGGGRFSEGTPTTISTLVPGRWRDLAVSERTRGESDEALTTHRVYCASSADIQRTDQLVRDDAVVFEVIHSNPISERGHHQQVDVWLIESGV
ncbi:MAG TPA: head-tail adaptor protein [Thermoleophilia bacterium]|nr:head-tail adaptor protein [Thermoleophilia bacterium]